jgi:pectate lyase
MCSNEQTEGRIRDYTGRSVLQSGCGSGNPIDDCWRCDPNWENNRQNLADCALGFGSKAVGGQGGQIYIVTDNSDNDTVNPAPGTLRYGVTQAEPLWIIFASDMNLTLKEELIMSSFKTIDGRGFDIHIAGGACLTLEYVTHVIVHGVHIHDCISTGPAVVRSNSTHFGQRGTTDGDAVNIFGSQDIWVDHCYFANCADGLVDVIMGSTDITVSNNYFTDHDKVCKFSAQNLVLLFFLVVLAK